MWFAYFWTKLWGHVAPKSMIFDVNDAFIHYDLLIISLSNYK